MLDLLSIVSNRDPCPLDYVGYLDCNSSMCIYIYISRYTHSADNAVGCRFVWL